MAMKHVKFHGSFLALSLSHCGHFFFHLDLQLGHPSVSLDCRLVKQKSDETQRR